MPQGEEESISRESVRAELDQLGVEEERGNIPIPPLCLLSEISSPILYIYSCPSFNVVYRVIESCLQMRSQRE